MSERVLISVVFPLFLQLHIAYMVRIRNFHGTRQDSFHMLPTASVYMRPPYRFRIQTTLLINERVKKKGWFNDMTPRLARQMGDCRHSGEDQQCS